MRVQWSRYHLDPDTTRLRSTDSTSRHHGTIRPGQNSQTGSHIVADQSWDGNLDDHCSDGKSPKRGVSAPRGNFRVWRLKSLRTSTCCSYCNMLRGLTLQSSQYAHSIRAIDAGKYLTKAMKLRLPSIYRHVAGVISMPPSCCLRNQLIGQRNGSRWIGPMALFRTAYQMAWKQLSMHSATLINWRDQD
jgi:hypothetical protein